MQRPESCVSYAFRPLHLRPRWEEAPRVSLTRAREWTKRQITHFKRISSRRPTTERVSGIPFLLEVRPLIETTEHEAQNPSYLITTPGKQSDNGEHKEMR
ncbi:hypothetical protein GN956_G5684 [Arapaima gigas]